MRFAHLPRRTIRLRTRLSDFLPVLIIVAVAVICIVTAVITSAQRADEVAIEQERSLFLRAIALRRDRFAREVENVVTSSQALRRIWFDFDKVWVHRYVGRRLKSYFGSDDIFVFDPTGRLIYALTSGSEGASDPAAERAPELLATVQAARDAEAGTTGWPAADKELDDDGPAHASSVQMFRDEPAIVVAVAVAPAERAASMPSGPSPIVVAVDRIDSDFLARLSDQIGLSNLREVSGPRNLSDATVDLTDGQGTSIARFAWTPKWPGAAIMRKVLPFVVVALGGLLVLAGFALRYMRQTAAAISAGEERLRYLAMHDSLSGLPNRSYFGDALAAAIEKVREGGAPAAVFYIDLDHFKDVNDTLGHPIGDALINAVTGRLRGIVREDAIVARLGGDEFAIISSASTDRVVLMRIAERIIATLCAPYAIFGQTIVIGASIGIATIDRSSQQAADVMRYADMALYRAKNEGRQRACIYDDAMDADLLARRKLESELREAIEREELELAYQPIFSADGEQVTGVEALARWNHRERGQVSPSVFIPIAENAGLIIPLGEWALRKACLEAMNWPGVSLAVNVSPLQFRRSDFVDVVERVLAETGFDPCRLELEITESTLLGNVDGAETAMRRLIALGVRLALDDFGTGYSSLLYLRRFPFDKLKIDSSFVRNIETAAEAGPIIHAIISLGRGLGMKVTAEGVESAEQHLFLRAAGAHFMQGYRFGRPESAAHIERLLTSRNPRFSARRRVAQAS